MRINSILNNITVGNIKSKEYLKDTILNFKSFDVSSLEMLGNYNFNFRGANSKPVYVFKKDVGLVEKIDSANMAKQKFGFPSSRLYNGPVYLDEQTVCVYADALESKDENNQSYLDDKKVDRMFKSLGWGDASKEVYAIRADGKYFKFSSAKEAAKILDVPLLSVQQIIQNRFYVTNGYTFVRASEFEVGREKNKINDKLYIEALARFSQSKKQAIYAIDVFSGDIKMFDSPAKAAKGTNVAKSAINSVISKDVPQVYSKNISYARVVDVAQRGQLGELILDENNLPVPDLEKINKIRQQALEGTVTPIVAVEEDGSYQIFKTSKDVVEKLGVQPNALSRSLNLTPRASKGFAYVRLREVLLRDLDDNVIFDEKNRFVVDEYKINKVCKQAF